MSDLASWPVPPVADDRCPVCFEPASFCTCRDGPTRPWVCVVVVVFFLILLVWTGIEGAGCGGDRFVRTYAKTQAHLCDGGQAALEACDLDDACEARLCRTKAQTNTNKEAP